VWLLRRLLSFAPSPDGLTAYICSMENVAYVFAEMLRAVCYLTLLFDIFARITVWFGVEEMLIGYFLRSVSDMISFPFRRLLSAFVLRHPFLDGLPRLCGTVFVFLVASLLPQF